MLTSYHSSIIKLKDDPTPFDRCKLVTVIILCNNCKNIMLSQLSAETIEFYQTNTEYILYTQLISILNCGATLKGDLHQF